MKKVNGFFNVVFLSFLILSVISVGGCSKNGADKNNNDTISIVATTFPCYDAVRAVLGDFANSDLVELKLLVKPGTEVHSFDPSPADLIAIKKSDLFVFIGGESDSWVHRILDAENSDVKTLKLMDFVNVLQTENHHHEEENHEHTENCYSSENDEKINIHEIDEHIWTSPKNEIKIVNAVFEKLSSLCTEKKLDYLIEDFDKNTKNYIKRIEKLSEEIQTVVDNSSKFIVVADRFPLVYFAQYFGIEYKAAFSGCSSAIETSTATISDLIETVKNKNLKAVYYMELGNHKIADTVAESSGVESLLLQSVQNVTKDDFENGETWISLMERNKKALEQGFN